MAPPNNPPLLLDIANEQKPLLRQCYPNPPDAKRQTLLGLPTLVPPANGPSRNQGVEKDEEVKRVLSTQHVTKHKSSSKPGPSPTDSTVSSAHFAKANEQVTKKETEAPVPKSVEDAMMLFVQQKKQAQRRQQHNLNATQRLVHGLAEITVALLVRALSEEIDEKIEVRIYKKPVALANGGYAVAEYRNGRKPDKKQQKKAKDAVSENGEYEFMVLTAGELLPGVSGKDSDCVENWSRWFDLVQSTSLWWRYCLAVHKKVGWKATIERSLLNVVDSRLLGFVAVTISKYV